MPLATSGPGMKITRNFHMAADWECFHHCAPGFYGGNLTNHTSSSCSGSCPSGYYCPARTIDPVPCPSGERPQPRRRSSRMPVDVPRLIRVWPLPPSQAPTKRRRARAT
jgi:hypothetical protein